MIPQDENIRRLKDLYRNLGYVSLFTHWRCFHTPYAELERLIPREGRILDFGCGYGLFSNLLALTSHKRAVIGLDISKRKLKYAQRNLSNTEFMHANTIQLKEMGRFVAIAMVHLLHHLTSYSHQEELLKLCYRALLEDGIIAIMEIDNRPLVKFIFTQLVDNTAYFGDRFYYRESRGFKDLLVKIGFQEINIIPSSEKSLFSHVIITGKKVKC